MCKTCFENKVVSYSHDQDGTLVLKGVNHLGVQQCANERPPLQEHPHTAESCDPKK